MKALITGASSGIGMEMAKMAQYNLQQTLMGNEATYFHRQI